MSVPKKPRQIVVQVVPDPPAALTWSEANKIAIAALFTLHQGHGDANFRIIKRAFLRQLK